MRHWKRLWIVALAVLGLSACTMTRFGYEVLPWLSMWRIERYIPLNDTQRKVVSRHLDELHQWHRNTQLPQYAAKLDQAGVQVATNLDPDQVSRWRSDLLVFWQPLADRLAPGLAELALLMEPAQIDRLARRLDREAEELRTKYASGDPVARIESRAQRWTERMQTLLGKLEPAQRAGIRSLAERFPSDEASWVEERQARGRDFVALLRRIERERPPPALAEQWSRDYLTGLFESRDPDRRARITANNANGDRLTAMMLNTASPSQRAHMIGVLRGYQNDFARLTGQQVVRR
jgi:FtsZ-binding cell division protein ZapB